MSNVLITDLYEESAYLMRSMLRGFGHAVSIAITQQDAEAKLATGLFDMLFMDYCTVVDENLAVGHFAADMLPGMPIVALTRPELESKLKNLPLVDRFHRPIRGQRVKEATARAQQALFKLATRRAVPRVHTMLPVELDCGGIHFNSLTIDLSSRGVAIDATEVKLTPDQLEMLENQVGRTSAMAKLTLAEGRVIELPARVAFVERHRTLSGRTVGLSFEKLDDITELAISGLTRVAA
ncbi:MAG: PilZ domain-containing protein [Planctomycetes bacterium]|nr:PilZ domain-containing protein [Planctomycetota bacterium]